jgi:two-component system response regulator YesN
VVLKKVLVVDDESDLRQTLADLVRKNFSQSTLIHQAESVEQALSFLKESTFDLIISDLSMPGGNGDEIYRYLEENPGFKTRFILYSGDFDPIKIPDWEKKFAAVLKPDFKKLLDVIRLAGVLCNADAV